MADATPNSTITPATSAQFSFGTQIDKVTASLDSRAAAKKKLTEDWKAIVAGFAKYGSETNLPARRQDPQYAIDRLYSIRVNEPKDPAFVDMEALNKLYDDGTDYLSYINQSPDFCAKVEESVPGFTALVTQASQYTKNGGVKQDTEKTKAAQDEVRALIDVMTDDLVALEDTEDTLKDVDKYISTVEKIANISAVANRGKDQQ